MNIYGKGRSGCRSSRALEPPGRTAIRTWRPPSFLSREPTGIGLAKVEAAAEMMKPVSKEGYGELWRCH